MNKNLKHFMAYVQFKTGLKEARLALATGISPQYINRLCKGEGNPSWDVLERITATTGKSMGEVIHNAEKERDK